MKLIAFVMLLALSVSLTALEKPTVALQPQDRSISRNQGDWVRENSAQAFTIVSTPQIQLQPKLLAGGFMGKFWCELHPGKKPTFFASVHRSARYSAESFENIVLIVDGGTNGSVLQRHYTDVVWYSGEISQKDIDLLIAGEPTVGIQAEGIQMEFRIPNAVMKEFAEAIKKNAR